MGGVQIGTVQSIGLDQSHHDIRVDLSVMKDTASWIKKDASAEIATQGSWATSSSRSALAARINTASRGDQKPHAPSPEPDSIH